jgi:lipopolysaccharide/colanic/teichoic acid biosynthesis glycosyltransferase
VSRVCAYLPHTAIKLHADLIDQVTLMHDISPTVKGDYYYLDLKQMSGINRSVKRVGDFIGSVIGLILLSPIMIFAAIKVKSSSQGPIFYLQERIGRSGKNFKIIKFRSMIEGAESGGEQLAVENDPRCTSWGLTMRKWRIDELPQFVNVLLGHMSIVGPRPERAFYIDKITREAPEYPLLLTSRPGITSWGQMRFGYARNIAEMKQRMRFDMLYVQHQSHMLDVKIMLMTIYKLLSGKLK